MMGIAALNPSYELRIKMTPSKTSHRHHFVPQFYLRAWQDAECKNIWVYTRNKQNQISYRHRPAKAVGYVNNLYSLKPEGIWSALNPPPDAIEKSFFSLIDNDAAKVHQKLITSGLSSLTSRDKLEWALFLNSLIERNPKRISEMESQFSIEEIKDKFIERWGKSNLLDQIDISAIHHNSLRHALVQYITDESFITHVANMRWVTVDIPFEGEHLLTSDMPLLINGGVAGKPIHLLSIALTPKRLLIIHSNVEEFDERLIRTLSVMHNIAIVENTQKYLISSRMITDGPFTKYSRVLNAKLNKSPD